MTILTIVLLIILATILFLVEIFLIPGISLAGILGTCSIVYANFYAFYHLGTTGGLITLLCSTIICISAIIIVIRSKALDKIALKKSISESIDNSSAASIKVGDEGITTTRLTLIGQAEINGNLIEVRSIDGFIDEHTPITVTRVQDGNIMVKKS